MFENLVFKDAWVLIFLPFIILGIFFWKRLSLEPSLRFSSTSIVHPLPHTWRQWGYQLLSFLRLFIIALFVVALAGPRSVSEETIIKSEGIAIALVIDASGSMAAEDFVIGRERVNRLDITKSVVEEFIEKRTHDQIGLIVFGGVAYTVCPLTTDYHWLIENLKRVELGLIEDGTAIGSAIMSAVSRLKNVESKSKIIVLLTDGANNRGEILPLQAAKVAQKLGIKIYTIGAGTKGYVPYPATDFFGRKTYRRVIIELDEESLQKIAETTHGKSYRANNAESLRKIYTDIDRLERSEIEKMGYKKYEELFIYVLMVALGLLICDILLRNTVLLRIP